MRTQLLAAGVIAVAAAALVTNLPDQNMEVRGEAELESFESSTEMAEFLESSSLSYGGDQMAARAQASDLESSAGSGGVDRRSKTNVQEEGVQEPDRLKFDGSSFYYSPETSGVSVRPLPGPRVSRDLLFPRQRPTNISEFEGLGEDFSHSGDLNASGSMMLSEGLLLVQQDGFRALNRTTGEKEWGLEVEGAIEASREINGSVYAVVRKRPGGERPCPFPVARGASSLTVSCDSVLYSPRSSGPDSTYSVVEIDASTGEIDGSTTVLGSASNTVVYVSRNSVYITALSRISRLDMMMQFLEEEGDGLLEERELERVRQIDSYNISDRAKMIELQRLFQGFDEGRRESFRDAAEDWSSENKRELSSTEIFRIDMDSMEVSGTGTVPGSVNDQFSMDEREGRLRIATTVGENSLQGSVETENDLYVLDQDLSIEGSLTGMGLDERIYSARFIGDRAYVVTFRRIDPFHVVDLSDPSRPELRGELKLPGFSSYLHPLDEDRILGIGEENGSVKAVVFDVADDDPSVEDSVVLDDYNSELGSNHHAFLLDRENEVFFLPGDSSGYVYSYSDGLERLKELEIEDPDRARYVNQKLYVFGSFEASVVEQESWETLKTLEFRESPRYEAPERE